MPSVLKLPTLDHQVPHDVAVAVELLRRAHEVLGAETAALAARKTRTEVATPTIPEIRKALSTGGIAPVIVTDTIGGLPPSPRDATVYLNGASIPTFAHVQDAHLALADIDTNNATTARHGFLRKLSGSANDVLNGLGEWVPKPPTGSLYTHVQSTAATTWTVTHNFGAIGLH